MKIALVTGPSGSGKSFVTHKSFADCECLSYDHLMRGSRKQAFRTTSAMNGTSESGRTTGIDLILLPRSSRLSRGRESDR